MGTHPRLASCSRIMGLSIPLCYCVRTLHTCSKNVKLLMGTHPRLVGRSPIIGLDPPHLPLISHIWCNHVFANGTHPQLVSRSPPPLLWGLDPSVTVYIAHM